MKVRQPVSINGNRQSMSKEPDPEVVPKAKRRRFSAEYKLRILAEIDECTERGAIGALLRREGLYSSHLDKWRKQRERGALEGLRGQKRGRKPDPQAAEIARLGRENEQLRSRLERAEHIIDVQKKLAELLGKMFAILRSLAPTLSQPGSLPKLLQTADNGEPLSAIRSATVLRRVEAASAVQTERFRDLGRPSAFISYDLGLASVLEAERSM